jgi:carboxypeptidase family protein/TonB-dependent receptor-like protein
MSCFLRPDVGALMLCLSVIIPGLTFAQSPGSLSGIVEDPSGGKVPGAGIFLRNLETNLEYKGSSSESGAFSFPSLLFGNYELKVTAPGFAPLVMPSVAVHVGLNAPVKLTLELAGVVEQVTVRADGQYVVNSISAELTSLVDRRQMRNLPAAARDAINFLRLLPGVAVPSKTDVLTASIHGLRGNLVNITQDGINIQDNADRSMFTIGRQNIDDIAEMTVAIGTLHSDYGSGAAQVRMVTPSGSNAFHGSLFEFHRNRALNANLFFNNQGGTPKPALIENRFGGRIGGPLMIPNLYDGRNRTFFFTSIDITRLPDQVTRNRTVWTQDARAGIFKYTDASRNVRQVNLLQLSTVYPVNPITKELLDKTPPPNNGDLGDGLNTQGYRFLSKQMTTGHRISGRMDHKLAGGESGRVHQLEVVMTHRRVLNRPDTLNNGDPAFPDGQSRYRDGRAMLVSAAIHSTLGPRTYNEIRWGMYRTPIWFARESEDQEVPVIVFPSGTGNSPQEPTAQTSFFHTPVYQLADNFSLVRDKHLFKWGVAAQSTSSAQWSLDGPESVGTRPRINLGSNEVNPDGLFRGGFPGISDSDLTTAQGQYALLVGLLKDARQTFNVANLGQKPAFVSGISSYRMERYRELNLYFRDQWHWRPDFVWNLGLRYELVFPPTIVSGGVLMPESGLTGTRLNSEQERLVLAGPGEGRPFWNLDKNNFAPFVGFAYQPPFRNHGISIRGGYTISYTRDGFSAFDDVARDNQGLQQTKTTPPLTGVLTTAGVPIDMPVFKVPINDLETYERTSGQGGFSAFDVNLRTPYVQQWSLGVESELPGRIAMEARYVGNHAQALLRTADLNEVDIFDNGFLQEFRNAVTNLKANGGLTFAPGAPGTVPLPIFSDLFAGLDPRSGFANSLFIQRLTSGQAGGLANDLSKSPTYQQNRANVRANFFKPYPNLNFARYTSNASHSTYNALQFEVRRRSAAGLSIQGNYTFSKVLTDAEEPGGETGAYRTLRNKSLEKHRADWDITHTFNATYVYDLPIGPGRRFSTDSSFIRKILEGWQISGLVTWQTGPYKTFTSTRLTVNQVPRMMPVPIGNAVETIRNNTGVFRTPQGVFWLNPHLLNISVDPMTGLARNSTLKPGLFRHPEAGEIGYLGEGMFKTPRFFQTDFSISKQTRVHETANIEFRAEFFNFFNNANFYLRPARFVLDSEQFGRITDTFTPRFMQLTMRVNW